mmetsp:Transcript_11008/g.31562  ORF Transcript_11008/g.31562 Transcript_11008/m.31562 type:complete len:320 (+) Transcript_11008:3146-4105(+)
MTSAIARTQSTKRVTYSQERRMPSGLRTEASGSDGGIEEGSPERSSSPSTVWPGAVASFRAPRSDDTKTMLSTLWTVMDGRVPITATCLLSPAPCRGEPIIMAAATAASSLSPSRQWGGRGTDTSPASLRPGTTTLRLSSDGLSTSWPESRSVRSSSPATSAGATPPAGTSPPTLSLGGSRGTHRPLQTPCTEEGYCRSLRCLRQSVRPSSGSKASSSCMVPWVSSSFRIMCGRDSEAMCLTRDSRVLSVASSPPLPPPAVTRARSLAWSCAWKGPKDSHKRCRVRGVFISTVEKKDTLTFQCSSPLLTSIQWTVYSSF